MPINKNSAVLFDLDGTLLDTAPSLHTALNKVLRLHQRPELELALTRPLASHGATGLLRLGFGENFNPNTRDELRKQFLDAYAEDVGSQTLYFDGVAAMLSSLQQAGIPYAIVTNKPTQFTQALLPDFAALQQSGAVVCGDTLHVAKPDPAPLLYAAEQLGVVAQDCWYVGDAERDIQAGKGAGMQTVLATYGYLSEEDDIEAWQAHYHIEHANDLFALLQK